MGNVIPLEAWAIQCVLQDARGHALEVSTNRSDGSLRLVSNGGLSVDLEAWNAVYLAKKILELCSRFSDGEVATKFELIRVLGKDRDDDGPAQ